MLARSVSTMNVSDEKELGRLLYQKILGLTKMHEPNKELKQVLCEDMFLKVNQAAFYQVMGYLFRTHDPAEFKRRFFWPLIDKKAEANFRTSTRDYLKQLNEKHHLNWADAISYLVMKPGGLKFIVFLLKIVDFVIDQLIKQKEKQLLSQKAMTLDATSSSPGINITQKQLSDLYTRNIFLKEFSNAYIKNVRNVNESLKGKIGILKRQFFTLAENTGLDKDYVLSRQFLDDLKANVLEAYTERITKEKNLTEQLNEPLQGLLSTMRAFNEKQNNHKKDLKETQQLLKSLQSTHPQLNTSTEGSGLNAQDSVIGSLISAFNCLQSEMQSGLNFCNELQDPNKDGLIDEMADVAGELERIERDILEFERKLTIKRQSNEGGATNFLGKPASSSSHLEEATTPLVRHTDAAKNLLTKAIHTPPIKLTAFSEKEPRIIKIFPTREEKFKVPDIAQLPSNHGRNQLSRVTSFSSRQNETSSDIFSIRNRSNIRKTPLDLLLSHQKNRSNVLQPELRVEQFERSHGILSSTTDDADSSGKRHLQDRKNLSMKELSFMEAKGPLTPLNKKQITSKNNILKSSTSSPFTPFGSRECSRIERTSDNLNRSLLEQHVDCIKNISIIKKVKNISQNAMNLSVSPSGRLESLEVLQRKPLDTRKTTNSTNRKLSMQSASESYEEPQHSVVDDSLKENSANILNTEATASAAQASDSKDLSLEINKLADAIKRISLPATEDSTTDNLLDITDGVLNDLHF